MKKIFTAVVCFVFALFLSGCIRHPDPTNPQDPFEGFNRAMFAFNMDIDHLIFRPISTVYDTLVPPPLKGGVDNFFDNVGELTTIPNDVLQGKFKYALSDFMRLFINTTLGLGGLFDVASHMGLPKHYEDFGLTLAYWSGGKPSAYLVLPLLGPGTFRKAIGLGPDVATNPFTYIEPDYIKYLAWTLRGISIRAKLLDSNAVLDEAFDPYALVRSAYLQRRKQLLAENQEPFQTAAERKAAGKSERLHSDRLENYDTATEGRQEGDDIKTNTDLDQEILDIDNTPANPSPDEAKKEAKPGPVTAATVTPKKR